MQELLNRIHNANCFDILKQLPDESVDLVLTDPPYMTTNLEYDKLAAKTLDFNDWKAEILRVAKPHTPILIFSSGKFTYFMVQLFKEYFRYELIWDKVNKTTGFASADWRPMLNHEMVLYFSKTFARKNTPKLKRNTYNHGVQRLVNKIEKRREATSKNPLYSGIKEKIAYAKLNDALYPKSILRFNKSSAMGIHPSAKPYGLIEYLLNLYSNEGDIVLDTFSGSGIVAYACKLRNRNFIATELDPEYYRRSLLFMDNDLFTGDL